MLHIMVGVFLILHGVVHLWYVVMARGLVAADANTVWNGKSWLFTKPFGDQVTMALATVVHLVTTFLFMLAGTGLIVQQSWWGPCAVAAALLSIAGIVGFWDGKPDHPIEKGLLGIVIDVAVLVAVLYFEWPAI